MGNLNDTLCGQRLEILKLFIYHTGQPIIGSEVHQISTTSQPLHKACYQIFVCQGTIEMPRHDGSVQKVSAGDFICGMHSEGELAHIKCINQPLMIVKYQADNLETIDNKFRSQEDLSYIPYFYGHGKVNDFQSAFLHGSPFKNPTNLAALVRFPKGTIVSSHYHDEPIFHEFIYLQGGHLTPDGYYAPGDHVTSIPGCKEGP